MRSSHKECVIVNIDGATTKSGRQRCRKERVLLFAQEGKQEGGRAAGR